MVINTCFLLPFFPSSLLLKPSFFSSIYQSFLSFRYFFYFSLLFISVVSLLSLSDMDSNSYTPFGNFVDLLNSQQDTVFGYVQDSVKVSSSQVPADRKERRVWSPVDDVALISAWLNKSKDPVVANEQRAGKFWKRIAAYFAASLKVAGSETRQPLHCKQRWQKINDQVNKFCGAYESATREKSSGQNENDVLKHAHEIYYNNHKKKFTLEHAWKELRNDQKWCELCSSKTTASGKKRKFDESAQSASSYAFETTTGEAEQATMRPLGVKASKRHGKKTMGDGKALDELESMWRIRKEDLAVKERMPKMKLLDSLVGKADLPEYEEDLKKKLIDELMSN
ncbi:glutathione S-transferase T3-like [Brassica napus]|uniref:glutathione S-transferase T3-like n=1 Tax=Brassica napus TaxID=3708 RepID=UPI002079D904|nr:glutathione S-transferase T3-like [Brassica napus]XP_048612541.1 glutathione S-transferase T3-like [Brassica napus]XP_048612542.1 glutathione S-transferase T3-like [Brassica napus]